MERGKDDMSQQRHGTSKPQGQPLPRHILYHNRESSPQFHVHSLSLLKPQRCAGRVLPLLMVDNSGR